MRASRASARSTTSRSARSPRSTAEESGMQISGKSFIVTGGASGLGEGTVRMLVANGGKVVIADVQAEKGQALAAELGAATTFVRCDVSQEADGRAAVAAAQGLGKLSGLV